MIVLAGPERVRERAVRKFDHDRIAEIASQRLRESGYPALSHVTCVSGANIVRLTGHVPTYYMKQVAQTIVLKIDGVEQVHNFLEVTPLNERTNVD